MINIYLSDINYSKCNLGLWFCCEENVNEMFPVKLNTLYKITLILGFMYYILVSLIYGELSWGIFWL